MPLSAAALTLYCLETYDNTVHNESSAVVCGYCLLMLLLSVAVWRRTKGVTALWILSALILAFVYYVGCKIPFCVVCDQVTAEDLGFLIHWIQPEIPPA